MCYQLWNWQFFVEINDSLATSKTQRSRLDYVSNDFVLVSDVSMSVTPSNIRKLKVIYKLGQGGCSHVYLADHPDIQVDDTRYLDTTKKALDDQTVPDNTGIMVYS